MVVVAAVAIIAGCASPPRDLGRSDVDALVAERGIDSPPAGAGLRDAMMAQPLSIASAMTLALIANPELQASYARLGFGAADVYAAGRISNPTLGVSLLDSGVDGERDQLTLGLAVSFTDVLTLGARSRLADAAFAALKHDVGAAVMRTAVAAQHGWIHYVAAQQVLVLRRRFVEAAGLSAALAERMHEAGNLSPRELAIAKASRSEAELQRLDAERDVIRARTALAESMGVSAGDRWSTAATLAVPFETEDDLAVLLQRAADMRLDLAAANTRARLVADRRGVVNWTRWLGELQLGGEWERETDGARLKGPSLEWELPIFDQHGDAILRADAELRIALADLRRLMLGVDNEVRLAHANVVNAAVRVDEYRQRLLPQRAETVSRAQQEFNYMLIGVFELISLKQQEFDTYQGYLEAVRDYWNARLQLAAASGGALTREVAVQQAMPEMMDGMQPRGEPHGGEAHRMHDRHDGHDSHDGQDQPEAADEHAGHDMPGKRDEQRPMQSHDHHGAGE